MAKAMSPIGLLEQWSQLPSRVFAVYEQPAGEVTTITYAQQLDQARRVAATLASLGVERGDRVHVNLPNCPEFLDIWLGVNALGAVLVPTNPLSMTEELRHFISDSGASVSITTDELLDVVRAAAPPAVGVIGLTEWGQLTAAQPANPIPEPPPTSRGRRYADSDGADVLAAILYTSGTTSRPKGVMVTNANYLAVGKAAASHYNVASDDRWLVVLPFFHANAQYYCAMSALVAGASIAVMPQFSATRWSVQAYRHRATLASLFAAPIRMILAQQPGGYDDRIKVRTTMFAQSITDAQAAEFEQRFNTRLVHGYGMTETVLPPTLNPVDESRRSDSMGKALPGVRLRIVDSSGSDVDHGDAGELLVAGRPGRTIAAGYWGNESATAETFDGGWLRTGDVVRRDANNFYYFVDRTKDMMKRAGENVSAGEIERVVSEHRSVFECAAIGVPDEMRDEQIVVYVVVAERRHFNSAALTAWCRARLAPFKVPSKFIQVDELPRTSVGKIRKADLRERFGSS